MAFPWPQQSVARQLYLLSFALVGFRSTFAKSGEFCLEWNDRCQYAWHHTRICCYLFRSETSALHQYTQHNPPLRFTSHLQCLTLQLALLTHSPLSLPPPTHSTSSSPHSSLATPTRHTRTFGRSSVPRMGINLCPKGTPSVVLLSILASKSSGAGTELALSK